MSFGKPKKRFSQNFLVDQNTARKIVGLLDIDPDDTIFEIGTGRGILTSMIAEIGARLYSFELDRELFEKIKLQFDSNDKVDIINLDFLQVKPEEYYTGRFKLIGNIPYDITSPLIDWIINHRDQIRRVVITTQKELADRISSGPGSKNWAPISIFSQCYYDIRYAFTISPNVFYPPPNVFSATMVFENNPKYDIPDEAMFEKVVRSAFQHRRKQMVKNLTKLLEIERSKVETALESLGLRADIRAEAVTIEQFIRLSELLS